MKIIFALAAVVFLLAIVSSFFGYFVIIAIVAILVAGLGWMLRMRARDRQNLRDLRRDLDHARRR